MFINLKKMKIYIDENYILFNLESSKQEKDNIKMGIHLFCGNASDREHEWEQLVEICETIHQGYDEDKEIYLLYNFELPNQCQIDLLIIQEKGISILEFKKHKGVIIGKDDEGTEWFVITDNGNTPLRRNLFEQIKRERREVTKKLFEIKRKLHLQMKPKNLGKVYAWGYFPKESEYDKSQVSDENKLWFDVITSNSLLKKLRYVNTDYKLSSQNMKDITDRFELEPYSGFDTRLYFISSEVVDKKWNTNYLKIANDFLQNELEKKSTLIYSIGLGEPVSYTPIKVAFQVAMNQHGDKAVDLDINFILRELTKKLDDEEKFKPILITSEGGSGKTSLSRQLFLKTSKKFMRGNLDYLPFLVQLSNYGSSKLNFKEWIQNLVSELELFGKNSSAIFRHMYRNGMLLFLVDGLDNLPQDQRNELNHWLIETRKFGNRLFITSRPYVEPTSELKVERLTILPLTLEIIENFIENRQKNKKLLKTILHKINSNYNPLLFNPFYLDLIASLDPEEFPDDEISLFDKWLIGIEHKESYLKENISAVEKLAFEYCFPESNAFSRDEIKSKTDDNDIFRPLERAGWIMPTNSYLHNKFVFTHDRLKEYLAGRFVWNNWEKSKNEIYLKENSLLHFLESNKIFEYAFLFGKHLHEEEKIAERITDIIGEVESLSGDVGTVVLRAPFLGFYLAGCMGLKNKTWYLTIEKFIKDSWFDIIEDLIGNKPRTTYLRYIFKSVCLAMLHIKPWTTILPKGMKKLYTKSSLKKMDKEIEPENKITPFKQWLLIANSVKDIQSEVFHNFVRTGYELACTKENETEFFRTLNKLQFSPNYKTYANHFVSDFETELGKWYAAAKIYINYYPEELKSFFISWTISEDTISLRNSIDRCEYLSNYKDLFSDIVAQVMYSWLNAHDSEIRILAINMLVRNHSNLSFDLDERLSELLDEKDYDKWLDVSKKRFHTEWEKDSIKNLRLWIYRKHALEEVYQIFRHKFRLLYLEIYEYYKESLELNDAIFLANHVPHFDEWKGPVIETLEEMNSRFNSIEISQIIEDTKFNLLSLDEIHYYLKEFDTLDEYKRSNIVDKLVYFQKLEKKEVYPFLEYIVRNNSSGAQLVFTQLIKDKNYPIEKKHQLLDNAMKDSDWVSFYNFMNGIFLNNPSILKVERYLEFLLKSEYPVFRFLGVNALFFSENTLQEKRLDGILAKEENPNVIAAAIRIKALSGGLNFDNVINFFNWKFQFKRMYMKEINIGATRDIELTVISTPMNEDLKFEIKNRMYSFGIATNHFTSFLQTLHTKYGYKKSKMYPFDIIKKLRQKENLKDIEFEIPNWLIIGLKNKYEPLIRASLVYLIAYLMEIKSINVNTIVELIKPLDEHDDKEIKAYSKFLLSLYQEGYFLNCLNEISEFTNIEQLALIWSISLNTDFSVHRKIFKILPSLSERIRELYFSFIPQTNELFYLYLEEITKNPTVAYPEYVSQFEKHKWGFSPRKEYIPGRDVLFTWNYVFADSIIWTHIKKSLNINPNDKPYPEDIIDKSMNWLSKLNTQPFDILGTKIYQIIEEMLDSKDSIICSLGILLSSMTKKFPKNFSSKINNESWVKANIYSLLMLFDDLPLDNSLKIIQIGLKSNHPINVYLALKCIKLEFGFKKVIELLDKKLLQFGLHNDLYYHDNRIKIIEAIRLFWKENCNQLLKEDFDFVMKWAAETNRIIWLSWEQIQRNTLFDILNWSLENEENQNLYWTITHVLFSRIWFSKGLPWNKR